LNLIDKKIMMAQLAAIPLMVLAITVTNISIVYAQPIPGDSDLL
jgi:hypothetical protein